MNKYEILYIIENDIDDTQKDAIVQRFADVVTSLQGTVDGIDKWGTKKYTYPINFKNEGYYVLMNFTADATVPQELARQMRITDSIVRQMTLKK